MSAPPFYAIDETTAFWSQEALVSLINQIYEDGGRTPPDLQNVNEEFRSVVSYNEAWGMQCFLTYGKNKILEFVFAANFDWNEDFPKLDKLYDNTTNSFKHRLDIRNTHYRYNAERVPVDIHIHIDQYSPLWQLAWQYKENAQGESVIEISRVDGHEQQCIRTLTGVDLGKHGPEWLRKRKPIVIQKHIGYITIRASAHLARSWDIQKSHTREKWTGPEPNYTGHTMSVDETAWIVDDDWNVTKSFLETRPADSKAQQAHLPAPEMRAMLGALERFAA